LPKKKKSKFKQTLKLKKISNLRGII